MNKSKNRNVTKKIKQILLVVKFEADASSSELQSQLIAIVSSTPKSVDAVPPGVCM